MKEKKIPGVREWNAKFSFLNKTGLNHLYLTILAMAQSKTDIKRIHNSLDPNKKILRNDLIELENFWEKYFKGDKKEAAINWLFTEQSTFIVYNSYNRKNEIIEKNNTNYYYDYLASKRLMRDVNEKRSAHRLYSFIISDKDRLYREAHFVTKLFNEVLVLKCYLGIYDENVLVKLTINEKKLTEELTYKLSQLPPYEMEYNESSCGAGREIDFTYYISAGGLTKLLTEYPLPDGYLCGGSFFVASEEFVKQLTIKMKQLEVIPVDGEINMLHAI